MTDNVKLFAFVNELADDHDALISKSRENCSTVNVPSSLPVKLQSLQKTAVIEIHSPAARNALSGKMMAELADSISILEDPQVYKKLNVVILKGTGGWFCAGADLKVAQHNMTLPEAGAAMGQLMTDTMTRLRRLPLVSIACVEGGAYGGGAELATACDFRIFEAKAVLQFVQVHMGVSPAWSGGVWLYKVVGRADALRLLCTAEKLLAKQALTLKLADFIFDATIASADAAICQFAAPFDVTTSAVSHGAKRVINSADDVSLDEIVSYEQDVFKSLWGGSANLDALKHSLKNKKQ